MADFQSRLLIKLAAVGLAHAAVGCPAWQTERREERGEERGGRKEGRREEGRGGRKEGRREEGRGGEKDLAPEARCAAGAVRGSCRLSRGLQHAAQESESIGRKKSLGAAPLDPAYENTS